MEQYQDNLEIYIRNLKDTAARFIYMTQYETRMKKCSKFMGHDYYATTEMSNTENLYVYVYKASDVKYMITEAQNNRDHVRVLNFKKIDQGAAESIDFDHPYLANHDFTFDIWN